MLRAHLNFAEIAGGPLHHASERQTAEEAGVSRTTLRPSTVMAWGAVQAAAPDAVLNGGLQPLRRDP
ncbi:hypothetical protein [Streptomyces sp. NBC_00268]|uniref:hypothetical protein n=1 Tax=Streptomyces sp. NBC_00268 TaxID=2975695 RepID=UPI00224EC130|nr:hypothetical protein [Streptomyces sp. NBC_00268]MCX5188124.1 hypothetical protein [Streptomyces sp. NBC_00268]